MNNRIRTTTLAIRRLSPVEAEVVVSAQVDEVTPTTEMRGRLVGPRCPGVTTIEVAYLFRPTATATDASAPALTARVTIPEPSLWSEQHPFVYEGTLELWQDGHCCDQAPVSIGLKSR